MLQDVRGRYRSDGEWAWPFGEAALAREADDGYDTVQWAAQLRCADGRVGTWGHSLDAWYQWLLASQEPPALAGMSASGMTPRILDWTHGIFETGRRLQWTYQQAVDAKFRRGDAAGTSDAAAAGQEWQEVERDKWVWQLPLVTIPESVFGPLAVPLRHYAEQVHREIYHLDDAHPKITVPVLMFTGWWDRLIHTVSHYTGLVTNGPSAVRSAHRLVVGPWGHDTADLTGRFDDIDHGPTASVTHEDLVGRFFDHHLKGVSNGLDDEPPVKIFMLGVNEWRFEDAWPPSGTRHTELYLHGAGRANTAYGDGLLKPDLPGYQPPDAYDYDPRDPVPSLMAPDAQAAPRDQAPLDGRHDVLVYQTPPLTTPMEVVGPVTMRLWAISDASDTDWTAKLVDVRPDGLAINVSSGIVRARYRDSYETPEPLELGVPYEYEIDMTPIAIVFGVGHRIRLDISSSDFPNFDRNHNTGAHFWSDPDVRIARQAVLHDREYPSHLVLPVR